MVRNLHLLKKELSVLEYKAIMPIKARRNITNWQRLPEYVLARCPFCMTKRVEKLDTYSLRRWYDEMSQGGSVSLSVFDHELVIQQCEHYALTQKFFHFSEKPKESQEQEIFEESEPFVIGHLLESKLCQAVIHALPICRIEEDKFIPSYTLFIVSYFSEQPQDNVHRAVHRYNDPYYSWEASATLYIPLAFGEPHWANFSHWVSAGQLYWVDATDSELRIKTQNVAAFPYKDLGNP